ncbi:MAG: heme-binding protein [Pseudomonadota bacterium]
MSQAQSDIRLGSKRCLTLEVVKAIAAAAETEAIKNNWKVSIAIVDDGANLLYLARLDGAQIASTDVALGKARTAMRYKRPSKALEDAVAGGRTALVAVPGITPLQGAVPILHEGEIIGAIGVSGVLPAQDEQIAYAGANTLAKLPGK